MGIRVTKKIKRKIIKSKRIVKKSKQKRATKSKRWHQITNRKKIWYLENRIKALENRVFSPPDTYAKILIVDSEKESAC